MNIQEETTRSFRVVRKRPIGSSRRRFKTPRNDDTASTDWSSEGNPNTERSSAGVRKRRTAKIRASGSSRQQRRADEAAEKVAREHEAVLAAVHELEEALASPAVGREGAWKQTAASAVRGVVESLRVHRESAENEGGIIAEAEAVLGRPPALSAARNQHKQLTKESAEMLAAFDPLDGQSAVQEVRRRGWRLASALHEHRALEADLIMEAFERDIGGEG
jgi:hypothetical protein